MKNELILIVGGAASGKRRFATTLGLSAAEMSDASLTGAIVYNLQNMIRCEDDADALLEPLKQKRAVICNEIGCGIVPVGTQEREAREATGRLLIELAANAAEVWRVCCGIGQRIK